MIYSFLRLLLDPAGTEGGNGNTTPPADPTAAYQALLAKNNNDAGALASKLFDENQRLSGRNTELQGQVPKAGTVVLSGDQVKAWNAYQKLGDPKDVATLLETGQASTVELTGIRTTEGLKAVAKSAGLNPDAFARLAKAEGLTPDAFEIVASKDAKGKDVSSVVLKAKDDASKPTPIADLVANTWPEFTAALSPQVVTPAKLTPGTPPGPNRPAPTVNGGNGSGGNADQGQNGSPDLKTQLLNNSMFGGF
jgi:hypothetical protein